VDKWIKKIHRMSLSQLKALEVLMVSKNGMIEANDSSKQVGLEGKSLGGVFSSLSRQKIGDESLILPWGKSEDGRGLRWKINKKIDIKKLRKEVEEVLSE
jgi:hypothetical protein